MKLPPLVFGAVLLTFAGSTFAQSDAMPNGNSTTDANGTVTTGAAVNPDGTLNGKANGASSVTVVPPPTPPCVPSATSACQLPNPNCQPAQTPPATPPVGTNCPPPVLPNVR